MRRRWQPRCRGCPARATCRCRRRPVRRRSWCVCVRSGRRLWASHRWMRWRRFTRPTRVRSWRRCIRATTSSAWWWSWRPKRATDRRRSAACSCAPPTAGWCRCATSPTSELTGGRYKILHSGGRRIQTVTASVAGRDLQDFESDVARARSRKQVKLAAGNYAGVQRHRARAGAGARGPDRALGDRRHRHLPAALHRLQQSAQPAHHLPQPAVRLDRRRDRGARDRRLAVARIAGRVRHAVRHHAAQLHHAGVALSAPGRGRRLALEWRDGTREARPSACPRS